MVTLHTSDGHTLTADVAEADRPRGVAVVCHPHPLYGGNRFNSVVEALFTALPEIGLTTIRFDFRAAHDHGVAERQDAIAAIEHVAIAGLPVVLAGYSFGALVALSTRDERITHVIAVAPPLGAGALAPGVPTLVIPPERDQYCPAERAVDITSAWVDTTVAAVPDADHFLGGRTRHVAELATAWIRSQLN